MGIQKDIVCPKCGSFVQKHEATEKINAGFTCHCFKCKAHLKVKIVNGTIYVSVI